MSRAISSLRMAGQRRSRRRKRKKRPPGRRCRCPQRRLRLCPDESCRGPDAGSPWPDTSRPRPRPPPDGPAEDAARRTQTQTQTRPLTPALTPPAFAPSLHNNVTLPLFLLLEYRSHASAPVTAQFGTISSRSSCSSGNQALKGISLFLRPLSQNFAQLEFWMRKSDLLACNGARVLRAAAPSSRYELRYSTSCQSCSDV